MRRRDFAAGLASLVTLPRAYAQQGAKLYRLAILDPAARVDEMQESAGADWPIYPSLFRELRSLGYVEGQNLVVERLSASGQTEDFAAMARRAVQWMPDVILHDSTRLALILKAATSTLPIVGITNDPVIAGIVSDLSHPGGNITGVSVDSGPEIWGKRLEFLRGVSPGIHKVGLLGSRGTWEAPSNRAAQEGARKLGMIIVGPPLEAPFDEPEYRRVFAAMASDPVDAFLVGDQAEHFAHKRLIVELAEKTHLPAIYSYRRFVALGGLISYGLDIGEAGRVAARAISQILTGSKPGDIPYYQAIKFELAVNLKTAKSLGLSISPSLLARADEVIE
jgi:putative tryptophan/tyrosine transport system substrate-binding protein